MSILKFITARVILEQALDVFQMIAYYRKISFFVHSWSFLNKLSANSSRFASTSFQPPYQ